MINVKSSKITDFILTPGFWADRQRMLSEITIYAVRDRFQETGRFDAMNCSWLTDMDKKPHVFWDSDIAKWVESVAYLIALGKNLDLQDDVEAVIDCIEANMDSTGYFNSYFLTIAPADRFTNRGDHELYTAGHLLEAAIAYYEATGRDRFLKLMMRNMDCIERAFVTEKTAHFITPGHEELELALFKLYKLTDDKKYFRLASFFIEERGRTFEPTHKALHPSYFQSHLPVREQTTAEGHSVRAVYLYCGMVDEALLAGDMELFNTCKTLFLNIVEKRMYITGGIGSSRHGECFTVDFDLPNLYAYTESCAAIGLVLFASRMLLIENNSIYSDIIERALYNGFLSSTSLSGDAFFYENPLEINEASRGRNTSIITDPEVLPPAQRSKVFNCSCCPPNITRFLALLGNLVYTESDDTIFVHQYMAGSSDALEIKTDYPLSGHIELNLKDSRKLAVSIPGWCEKYTITDKEGNIVTPEIDRRYAYLEPGSYSIDFDMTPAWYEADPHVRDNAGKVALMRGPIVYCLEEVDNGALLFDITVAKEENFELDFSDKSGAPAVFADGFRRNADEFTSLYRRVKETRVPQRLRFIPYFSFANRGTTDMLVWVRHE